MAFPDRGFQRFLEAIPDAALAVAADGTIAHANSQAERLFGYGADGLAGRAHDHLVPEAARAAHGRGLAAFFARPDRRPMAAGREVAALRADGSEFPAECFLSPLEAEGGPYALAVIRDLTERRRSVDALRESERRHRSLLDTLPHGVQENDCSGVITYSNRAHHRILGFADGDLVGRPIWERQPTEEASGALRRHLADLVDGQPEPVPFLTQNRRKDGSLVDLQIDWDYRRDGDGALVGFLSVITDVTERRQVEGAMRRRSLGFATLLEVSQSLAATLDLDRVLQAAVDGATALFGAGTAAVYLLEGDAVRLQATAPPLPPDFPEDLRLAALDDHPHLRAAITSGKPLLLPDMLAAELTPAERAVAELRGLRSILYLPLLAGVEPLGALIVASTGAPREISAAEVDLCRTLANLAALTVANARLHDVVRRHAAKLEEEIDERNRAEEDRDALQMQLAHAQKMEAVGRLAGGVAHDFNNMLAVILGRAELALLRANPEGSLRQDLAEILQAAERSAVLTRQLLAFARKQTVSPRVLDLNEVVGRLLRMLRRLIGEDVDLVWLPGAEVWNVHLDPSQLDQVLANLVVNARDAIAGTGRISLETRNVALRDPRIVRGESLPSGEYVLLTVTDDGCGMDEETLTHLFEPFFTTKGKDQGTGLGLATVYGVIRQSGGFVEVRSEPRRGTTFHIYLPRARGDAEVPSDPDGAPTRGRGETVLLVEDEEAILTLGREMLERLGYRVLAASTPGGALRLADAHPDAIHLLVSDVVMPEMNGRDLAERLAAARPALRCLFVSGYTADVIAHRGVLEEGLRLLEKPFTIRELAARVREALEGGPGLRGGAPG